MIDGIFWDKLEAVARTVRKNPKPFGGVQLVVSGSFLWLPIPSQAGFMFLTFLGLLLCSGDFLQLPPVAANSSSRSGQFTQKNKPSAKFAFQSHSWARCFHTMYLLPFVCFLIL
jgi:hypothetical protein